MNLKELVEKLGGPRRSKLGLGKALGGTHTMVNHWEKTGAIPEWRKAQIRELAKKMKVKLEDDK